MIPSPDLDLVVLPLFPDRFADFERLFGPNSARGGCGYLFWKLRGRVVEVARCSAACPIFCDGIGE